MMERKLRGHRKMVIWQNIDQLDVMVQAILKRIPRQEFKLKEQIDSASDSVEANFLEGYYSGSLPEYIRFSRYGKRSLGELQGRIRRTLRKGYILQSEFERFDDLSIRTMYLFDRLLRALEDKLLLEVQQSKRKSKRY